MPTGGRLKCCDRPAIELSQKDYLNQGDDNELCPADVGGVLERCGVLYICSLTLSTTRRQLVLEPHLRRQE